MDRIKNVKVYCTHCGADNIIELIFPQATSIGGDHACWYCKKIFSFYIRWKENERGRFN